MKAQTMKAANRAIIQEWRHKMLGGIKCAKDINHGLCEVWADWVCARLPGAGKEINYDGIHVAVRYQGRLYDAECHGGVDTWEELERKAA